MKSPLKTPVFSILALALALTALTGSARANVYATNLKVNGSTNTATVSAGSDVTISYILNEPASAGVTLQILSGNTVVRSMAVAAGNPGTLRGTNTVIWNGSNDAGRPVAGGDYSCSITAAAAGYSGWTQTSFDTNSGNQVLHAWGIAVNQNTNSFYYGRIFVANSPYPDTGDPLDPLGFYKLNADGSPAEEGLLSDGGYAWTGYGNESPFRVKVGADDRFYALDWAGNGVVMSWDQQITSNSILNVMTDANNPSGLLLSGFTVTGMGTNRQLWMVDDYTGGQGVVRWDMQPDGTLAPADTGTQIIAAGTGSALDDSAFDIAIDQNGSIYVVCQPGSDAQYKIMRFPAYSGTLLTNADWQTDNTSFRENAFAVAVNPAATYVAVALNQSNALQILDANNGASITNIPVANPAHAVAWDNAGNAYVGFGADGAESLWQTWSPPGPNQATTTALETIQVLGLPQITSISHSGNNVAIQFTGPSNDLPSAYIVLSGSVPSGITNNTGAIITGSGGSYQAALTTSAAAQFYRLQRP